MRVPIRKGDPRLTIKIDPVMTAEKYRELQAKLEFMIKVKRPREAEEVKRLALMGDFSENAGYQLAKGRLRGLNQRIIDLEKLLARAEIIQTPKSDRITLGSYVTIKKISKDGKESPAKTYRILGGSETDPSGGVISHQSPLGGALLNKQVGDKIKISPREQEAEYLIVKVE